jgi:hypothetical protein
MPKDAWATKLGDIAEDRVSATLRYFCVVNKHHREFGIDFACERLESGAQPLHFFVQAKGSRDFDKSWSRSIRKQTVQYWLSQPHPVMLIVYDEKAKVSYWMSIESHRYQLLSQLGSTSQTIPITLDRSKVLIEEDTNDEFLTQIKADQGSIMLWMGHPQPKGEGYLKQMPPPPRSPHELAKVEDNLRMIVYSLVRHYMDSYEWKTARHLCTFLTEHDRSHYNQFVMLAHIEEVLGDRAVALFSWKEALDICERDKKWERKSMNRIKEAIKTEIRRLEPLVQDELKSV